MSEAVVAEVATDADRCACGHERDAHEHYRGGSECALCPPAGCPGFHRAHGVRPALRELLVRLGAGQERRGR